MNNEELKILIHEGHIWPEKSSNYRHSPKAYFEDKEVDMTFVVSDELFHILETVFQDTKKFEIDHEHLFFKRSINNKLELISPLDTDKIEFFKNQIKEISIEIDEIVQDNYYDTIPELIEMNFLRLFFDNAADWIRCLKFEVLSGGRIEDFSLSKSKNQLLLREYFRTPNFKELYRLAVLHENLQYMRSLLNEKTNCESKQRFLTHRGIAILCILKRKPLYEKSDCIAAIKEYNPELKEEQYEKVQTFYRELKCPGDNLKTSFKTKNQATEVIKCLEQTKFYLTEAELEKANLFIDSIKIEN